VIADGRPFLTRTAVSVGRRVGVRDGLPARVERLPALDSVAPMDAAEALRDVPGLALLESARPGRRARWSYLSADPRAVVEALSPGHDPFT